MCGRLVATLGDRVLQDVTTADVERVLDQLIPSCTGATANRYRDLLSAMFKRAVRLGLVPAIGASPDRYLPERAQPPGRAGGNPGGPSRSWAPG